MRCVERQYYNHWGNQINYTNRLVRNTYTSRQVGAYAHDGIWAMKLNIIETSQCPAGAQPGNESRTSHTKHRLIFTDRPTRLRAADVVFTQQQIRVIQHGLSCIKLFHEHTNTPYCIRWRLALIEYSVTRVVISKMILITSFRKFITAVDAFDGEQRDLW